ncbi:programmed cell death protein 1 isoform X1 [Saimiri boliviensis]|uniref:Programmed cell death protein 1 n=1 Tax=Saimiri boliviensis boliviensis TaxID=39432 RepID=A0A2K6U601_SAIBB|nr:programmed cell death protein 1 [Saimiri boliviensis boliviensis]
MQVPRAPWPVIWAVLQLGWRQGWFLDSQDRPWNPPAFSPALLTVAEGDNATFTCSFSNTSGSFVLNWYRMSPSNQTDKLAAFPEDRSQPGHDRRFRVTQLPNGRDFRMSVIGARRDDSGTYLCGAISLAPTAQIKESPRAELRVTERNPDVPTAHPSPSPRPAGQFQGLMVGIVVGLLASLVLLAWVLVAICPRAAQGAMGVQRTDQPLKEDPSAVPVFSVDYGELDFQWREKTSEPPAPCVPEQTEYATIVFSSGLGASSSARRGSAEDPRSPRPLRPEDGHCSWPL